MFFYKNIPRDNTILWLAIQRHNTGSINDFKVHTPDGYSSPWNSNCCIGKVWNKRIGCGNLVEESTFTNVGVSNDGNLIFMEERFLYWQDLFLCCFFRFEILTPERNAGLLAVPDLNTRCLQDWFHAFQFNMVITGKCYYLETGEYSIIGHFLKFWCKIICHGWYPNLLLIVPKIIQLITYYIARCFSIIQG